MALLPGSNTGVAAGLAFAANLAAGRAVPGQGHISAARDQRDSQDEVSQHASTIADTVGELILSSPISAHIS